MAKNELDVFYQPQIEAAVGGFCGFEALLRWEHSEFGMISPATFIPLAEETRLINSIGDWVLSTACSCHSQWKKHKLQPFFLAVAVNVSIRQLKQEGFSKSVEDLLLKTGLAPENLEIELTESIIMDDPQNAIKMLTRLRSIGVRIALDDFGTGYSSLSYLRKLCFGTDPTINHFWSEGEKETSDGNSDKINFGFLDYLEGTAIFRFSSSGCWR